MANHVSHAALYYPIKNARFTVGVPYLDADGDPTDPVTPDTEFSLDGGTYADCTEEVTTLGGSNGSGYITLTGAETNGSLLFVCGKVGSGPKATLATLYPRDLPVIESGTAQSGGTGHIVLASNAAGYDLTGCFVRTKSGTGGGGTGGANNQARRVKAYNPTTKRADVSPDWEVTPDNTTGYDVLLPEGVTVASLQALRPNPLGQPLYVDGQGGVDAWHWRGGSVPAPNSPGVPLVDSLLWRGGSIPAPAVTGVPMVDASYWKGSSVPTPNFGGVPRVDLERVRGQLQTVGDLINELTTLENRLGAFSGSGSNTVLGLLRALARSDVSAPSDLGGTYAPSADSLQALASGLVNAVAERTLELDEHGNPITWEEALRGILAAAINQTTGAGSGVFRLRDAADSKDRVVMETDASGNRTNRTALDLG